MVEDNIKYRVNKKYIAVSAAAVFLTWTLHELAHWTTGEYLGCKMAMTLNSSYLVSGQYASDLQGQIISAAGPLLTICEALIVFILMMSRRRVLLYPFLFTCFYMRFFAMIISFRNPNDEARISTAMGIGKFTLPLIMTLILFALVYKISKQYRFSARFNLANLGLVMLFSSMIILADMYFKIKLM